MLHNTARARNVQSEHEKNPRKAEFIDRMNLLLLGYIRLIDIVDTVQGHSCSRYRSDLSGNKINLPETFGIISRNESLRVDIH
jgi:hypothetical protein